MVVKSMVMDQSSYRNMDKDRRKFDREVWRQGKWGGFTEGFLPSSGTTALLSWRRRRLL